jgi:hypothetical protein
VSRVEEFSVEQIRAALQATGGNRLAAAQVLKCERRTVSRYLKRYPELHDALHEINETLLDRAEAVIVRQVIAGDIAACWKYLQLKGRNRGYGATFIVKPETAPVKDEALETLDMSEKDLRDLRDVLLRLSGIQRPMRAVSAQAA